MVMKIIEIDHEIQKQMPDYIEPGSILSEIRHPQVTKFLVIAIGSSLTALTVNQSNGVAIRRK